MTFAKLRAKLSHLLFSKRVLCFEGIVQGVWMQGFLVASRETHSGLEGEALRKLIGRPRVLDCQRRHFSLDAIGTSGIGAEDNTCIKTHVKFQYLVEGDRRFGRILTKCKSRKQRERAGIILLEGWRLIADALNAGGQMKTLYFHSFEALEMITNAVCLSEDVEVYKIHPSHLKLLSHLQTPPGVIGVFKQPSPGELPAKRCDILPVTVVCDNIRDPGNMGTLLRCAAAAGCDRVLTTKGCTDVWDSKVLRGGSGAHFRIPVIDCVGWESVGNYLPEGCCVYLADTPGGENSADLTRQEQSVNSSKSVAPASWTLSIHQPVDYTLVSYTDTKAVAVVIGGETAGVSDSARKLAGIHGGQSVFIPMMGGVNSLNSALAAGIILFEVKRQMNCSG